MVKYIIKRILILIPIMIGVITIVFCIRAVTKGDPVDNLVSVNATEEMREAKRHELGLDKPLVVQYFTYLKDVFTGDLGTSYTTKQPVLKEIFHYLPTTAIVCFGAVILGAVIGIPLGVWSARRQYTWIDSAILVISMIARSIPSFCLAFFLISLFSVKLHWLPAVGITDPKGYILPMITIAVFSMSAYTRITRSSMLEEIRKDYINTARAKGLSETEIINKHAFRNASIPVVYTFGSQISMQLGGSLVIETVFGIPGVGKYIGDAVTARNFPVIQGGVIFLAFVFCICNLLVDLCFTIINPQLKVSLVYGKQSKLEKWFKKLFAGKRKGEVQNG